MSDLTERQLQVLHLLSHGYRNRDIAERLSGIEHAIKMHVGRILKKRDGATNRAHTVRRGFERGILLLYAEPADLSMEAALAAKIRTANLEPLFAALTALGWTSPDGSIERE